MPPVYSRFVKLAYSHQIDMIDPKFAGFIFFSHPCMNCIFFT